MRLAFLVVVLLCTGACSDGATDTTDAAAGPTDSGATGSDSSTPDSTVGVDTGSPPDSAPPCSYPAGANERMAVGEVLFPYRWATSLTGAREDFPLDLMHAPCNTDPNIEWSPFDVLVFVSIPAW